MRVDRSSPLPITHQLEELLARFIADGELSPGQRLPTEMELCERLGVSRTPIRQALGQLVARGLLVRYPGRGTFVAAANPIERGARRTEVISITVPDERWCGPLQRAAVAWNQENPGSPVRLRFQTLGPAELRNRLMLDVAEGTASDISLIDSAWVAEFAERGYLQPFASIDPQTASELMADLVAPLHAENAIHGELFAMPAEADFALVWYRKDWFAEEGLEPPQTWANLVNCARHFQRASARDRHDLSAHPLAFAGGAEAGEATVYQLLPVIWSAGAEVIANHQVVLNTPAARSAVTFVADLVRKHGLASRSVVDTRWNGSALAFASGVVALAFGGSYEGDLIRAAAGWDETEFLQKVGFVPIPAGPGGQCATVLGGLSYGIFRQSQRPALALALLERASRPAALLDFCVQTGQNPPTISATQALVADTEPFLHATAQLFRYARPRWPIAEYARVSAQLAHMFEAAITGEAEPSEAVARAAAVIAGITGLPERSHRRAIWRGTTKRSGPLRK